MGITTFDKQEDYFSSSQTATGKLSILIGMGSFCYGIADNRNRLAFIRRIKGSGRAGFSLDLESISRDNPYLFFPFAQTVVHLAIPKHVWVPGRLYNPAEKIAYLRHGNDLVPGMAVWAEEAASQEAHLVYPLPSVLEGWLNRHFPQAVKRHLCSGLMNALDPLRPASGYHILAHVWEEGLWAMLFDGKRLTFGNFFACKDVKDFLYFLLLIVQQFNLRPEEVPVVLSGGLVEQSEVYALMHKYFSRLTFAGVAGPVELGPRLSEYPRHFYNDLLAGLMPK